MIKKLLPFLFLFIISFIFFKPFIFEKKLPIPADTIVGLYYPFRDLYAKTNPNGIPFKNFLITDPVRQTYPWRNLALGQWKNLQVPVWNPYNFAGTPLLANFQSAVFYPFNLIFFVLPFDISWSFLIILQPFLAGFFIYFYLNNLRIKKIASIFGALTFSFSGFFIAWMEWGTVLNTALWLPLMLLSIDNIFYNFQLYHNLKLQLKSKNYLTWAGIFLFAIVTSFFAGHLQTFFYLAVFTFIYLLVRWFQFGKNLKILAIFLLLTSFFLILTSVQWLPSLQFILQSARNADLSSINQPGWFIPWQNLIQFIAPDFFGNPSTLNYFGVWNYAEFVGYVGIFPLIMAVFALFFRKDKKTLFFAMAFFSSLLFAFPTLISKIPFIFQMPLISTSQPTRLTFIMDFSLSVLAAFGLDFFLRSKNKNTILYVLGIFVLLFCFLWLYVLFFLGQQVSSENVSVSRQNIILPTALFIIILGLLIATFIKKIQNGKNQILNSIFYILILITAFDLFRFGWKFESFSDKKYLFPDAPITSYLKSQSGVFRVISSDATIFPPNFSIMYKIQTLDGYDPLYLRRFGELMAAVGRSKPDISTPFGFNRIITPQNYSSPITDLLNVKYILSTKDLSDSKLQKVIQDGNVRIYLNNLYFERAFFVEQTLIKSSKQEAINALFDMNNPLKRVATVEEVSDKKIFKPFWRIGKVTILDYQENKVTLQSENEGDGFLVLTDAYYPNWRATVDGKDTKIYITNYAFRGIIVPKGKHRIEFYNNLF